MRIILSRDLKLTKKQNKISDKSKIYINTLIMIMSVKLLKLSVSYIRFGDQFKCSISFAVNYHWPICSQYLREGISLLSFRSLNKTKPPFYLKTFDVKWFWAAWENFSSGLAAAQTHQAQPIQTQCAPVSTNHTAEQVFLLKCTNHPCLCRTLGPMVVYSAGF